MTDERRLSVTLLACRRALASSPEDPGLLADLGGIYLSMGRSEEALQVCEQALNLSPSHPGARVNAASAHQALGHHETAERLYRQILAVEPTSITARFNLGRVLALTGREAEALEHLDVVLAANPRDGEARLNRGFALARLWRFEEAMAEYDQACVLMPDPAEARWNRGILGLLAGDYQSGWEGYEARWETSHFKALQRGFSQPCWNGEGFPGKTLLVHAEQGFGDTLMFARFLPQARARGGRLILEAPGKLQGVLSTCSGIDQFVMAGGPLPLFDLHLPLHSLGRIFCPDPGALAPLCPYLTVPEQVPRRLELEKLLAPAGNRRIGLVWAGNPGQQADRSRSLDPGFLEVFAKVHGIQWFSLQVGSRGCPPLPGLVDLGPCLGDFSDTAFALSRLDLLITVDTSIAHLAGALGRPAWVLLHHFPDWRWMLDREVSPWYPNLRLYRQTRPGDWGAVLAAVLHDLQTGRGTC